MQLHLRKSFIPAFFVFVLFTSFVLSASVDVKLAPVQTLPNQNVEFSLSVANLAGDNVKRVEITVPQNDNTPLYLIKELGNPSGWTYETRYTIGAPAPYRVIWSNADSGLQAGATLNFNFVASSPSVGGDHQFEWKVVDAKGEEKSGTISVSNFNPVFSSFDIKAPSTPVAGKEFDVTVTALDQSGNKIPYAGTIKFSSSDTLAVLPSDYTFQPADNGMKTFKIKLKTMGEQSLMVTDGTASKSVNLNVLQGEVNKVQLELSNTTALPNTLVTFTVWSYDLYGNKLDVTKPSSFEIEKQAKGSLANNIYTTEVKGNWTVIASYSYGTKKLYDGMLLMVVSELPKPVVNITNVTEPKKNPEMVMTGEDLIVVPFNSTKSFTLTVRNTGDVDLKNVSIYFTGFNESLVKISPSITDIKKDRSQRFTVEILSPQAVEQANIEFVALSREYSSDDLSASKTVTINVTQPDLTNENTQTGGFALSKNLTYLGIAITVAVVLIILFWALFLREEPKKKRAE
ncbi:MAG: hypothetical protein HYW24_03815 [Candidatus Aenigmarchaeota archaeon]|nr:hypothetical protein [Candidatus Aenigmarchaeota archaeon]